KPYLPNLSNQPKLPKLPNLPNLPNLPELPELPDLPAPGGVGEAEGPDAAGDALSFLCAMRDALLRDAAERGLKTRIYEPTERELDEIRALRDAKYADSGWIFGRSSQLSRHMPSSAQPQPQQSTSARLAQPSQPPPVPPSPPSQPSQPPLSGLDPAAECGAGRVRFARRFAQGGIEVLLDMRDGLISACTIRGDFLGLLPVCGLERALLGLPLRRGALRDALDPIDVRPYLGGITKEAFLECLFKGTGCT
ncbi:MAG: hypothetical protein LBU58_10550, partial [Clostridiales bacterium]|nr:hypothetical protein [Clostridiales bacterium]